MMKYSNSLSSLDVNIDSLEFNYKTLSNFVQGAEVAAVVKANAYGFGAIEIAKLLYQFGCRNFYVAVIDEAVELRKNIQADARIFCLNGVMKGEEYYFLENRIIPVINNFSQLSLWSGIAEKLDCELPANIFFDTKMYRLGFDYFDVEKVKRELENSRLKIHYIMSHLSCAHFKDHPNNREQLDAFRKLAESFPDCKTSFANSDGIFLGKEYREFDQVRMGINFYGYGAHKELGLKEVATFSSKIIQIREIQEEGGIGYSALDQVRPGMRVAILSIGFADGYFLRQAKGLEVYVAGTKCRAIGAVSMDLLAIDVTEVASEELCEGRDVEIFGENISVETVAEISNTSRYGLFTSLGHRVKRNYVSK